MSLKTTRKSFSLSDKVKFIEQMRKCETIKSGGRKLNLPYTTVHTIWKKRKEILGNFNKYGPKIKKVRRIKYHQNNSNNLPKISNKISNIFRKSKGIYFFYY